MSGKASDILGCEIDKALLLAAADASGLALEAHGWSVTRNTRESNSAAQNLSRIECISFCCQGAGTLKALIMLVRAVGLISILLGALVWADRAQLLAAHIAAGFLVSMAVFALAVAALLRKAVVPGVLGVVLAVLLPVIGFLQLPLTVHSLRLIQVLHIMVALSIIGVAERLYSATRT